MQIVYDDKTQKVSLLGLTAEQVLFLDVILIRAAFEARSPDFRAKADALQLFTNAGWKMIVSREEEAHGGHL